MTPQEWIKDTLNRWPSGHHVTEGATHLAAALEEIARLRAEAGRVVVLERAAWLTIDEMSDAVLEKCGIPKDYANEIAKAIADASIAKGTHSVPSSRVLKDGEVAVGEAELVALRDLERLYRGTAMPSREMTKICVDLSKIRAPGDWESTPLMWRTDDALRTQATATESGKAREVEG